MASCPLEAEKPPASTSQRAAEHGARSVPEWGREGWSLAWRAAEEALWLGEEIAAKWTVIAAWRGERCGGGGGWRARVSLHLALTEEARGI